VNEPAASLAVLPFRDLSTEPDTAYLVDGFVEDLIANLTRFGSLRVVAGQSTFALVERGLSVPQVAKDWDLEYVLEGSVRKRGDALRIGTKLVRVDGWQTIWAERFDASTAELLDLEDAIAATVAGRLAVRLDESELERARRKGMEDLEARDCWLRGMDCLRRGTLEGDEESRTFFRRALEIDPHFARAFSGLSLSHFNEWTCHAWHLWDESSDNAFTHAERAAGLDPSDAMVQAVLARVCRFRHEHARADRHAASALALNPNDPHVLIQVAITRLFGGEFDEARELAEQAIRLNPLHGHWYHGLVGWCLFMAGRTADALPRLEQGGETIINFAAYRAACHALAGRIEEARREWRLFLDEHRDAIAFGRGPEPGEALRWAVQVEPFRSLVDSRRMPDALREGGLAEVDVEEALRSRPGAMVRPAGLDRPATNEFRREGRVWSVAHAGEGARLVELKGFHDIARLLSEPHEPVHCLELQGAPPPGEDRHEVLDARARREYRQRIEELQRDLELAEADNDPARSEPLRVELDHVIDELGRAVGLGGKARRLGDPAERARTAVTWRIRSAIQKIRAAHPRLGRHLENSIRTGAFCVYSPEAPTTWQL
jgi:TolB-like protein/tetratricopeptide (TPR) repeat protein